MRTRTDCIDGSPSHGPQRLHLLEIGEADAAFTAETHLRLALLWRALVVKWLAMAFFGQQKLY